MKFFLLLLASFAIPLCVSAKTLVIVGDSITEGYGVAKDEAYPALLQKKLKAAGKDWTIVNSGVSGSTSASALSRVKWALKSKPDALMIALGGNDGLRGLSTEAMEKNLKSAVKAAKDAKVKVFLAGIQMPPNFGKEYTDRFKAVFPKVAKDEKIELLPFLIEGVGGESKYNLEDRIHPNEAGHKIVAEHVFQFLKEKL